MRWKTLSDSNIYFSSENLDMYLKELAKELAKEFKKLNGKQMPAEIILTGGAAILANYGFRERTYDIDAVITASSAMKQAINNVGDRFNLPNGWLNSDFKNTPSYSPKISQYSIHYKTFSGIVDFRTVSAEYLIAMKLVAGRPYKHDLSDVAEIIAEHQKRGNPIERDTILSASEKLYGDISRISETSMQFLDLVYSTSDIQKLIEERKESEQSAKKALIEFEGEYEGILNQDNLSDILKHIQDKKDNKSSDKKLKKKKSKGFDYGD